MKLITVLENLKNDNEMSIYMKTDELFKIADKYDVHELLEQIVDDEQINMIVKDYMTDWNSWELVAIFLADVKVLNQEYYYLNGYGNLENLTSSHFDNILYDFIEEIKYKGLENEEI